jgi:hypothetical protein
VAGPGRYRTDAARSHGTCDNAQYLTRAVILISSEHNLLCFILRCINGNTVNTMIIYYNELYFLVVGTCFKPKHLRFAKRRNLDNFILINMN